MIDNNFVFVDVETTGCSPQRDSIIEIAIIRVEAGKIIRKYKSLVNPGRNIPPEITVLTGITGDQLEKAPTFNSIASNLKLFLNDAVFVAHNARFDYSFIKTEFSRIDESFTAKVLCTAKLSRWFYPRFRHHNLDSIIKRFDISCDVRHRAYPDAAAIWNFFQIIKKTHGINKLKKAISDITKTAALPPALLPKTTSYLPESPGVYIFYNQEGIPLYIGKSINVHDRVLSHFYDFSRSQAEANIYQNIASIETHKTDGELGALLLESELIKKLKPMLNRQLRSGNNFIALRKIVNPQGFLTIKTNLLSEIAPADLSQIVAVFRSKIQQKSKLTDLCKQNFLCQKLLGLEKTSKACFGYQIGTCYGACLGKEIPIKYNIRFIQAFSESKIRDWPFPGPIIINEGQASFLLDLWCYIGKTEDIDQNTYDRKQFELKFDFDTYRILSSFILRKAKNSQIRLWKNHK
jgi:DNA polymerase III subunit epsilon